MAIKLRTEVPCPTCGAAMGEHCKGLLTVRYHGTRQLRVDKRPCGCVVYRHDGLVKVSCHRIGHTYGERHPDMVRNPETKSFAFPQEGA